MTSATYSNGITDPAEGQSKWPKPENYEEPLPRAFAPEQKGRFIRLSRLWAAAAANPNVKEAQFREITRELFESEGIPGDKIDKLLQPMGELMTTLRDTKLFIVGSPSVATAAIDRAPLAALDLPPGAPGRRC